MSVTVRLLTEADLAEADRINRVAFGTFFGVPDPGKFRGDGDVVHGRFRTDPKAAFAAELDGRLVGTGFCMEWGSVGILGPLTVDVKLWSRGIARALLPTLSGLPEARGHTVAGLFTHPQSPKHIRLYEEFDFWMQRPTAVMEKPVSEGTPPGGMALYSQLSKDEQAAALLACRDVTKAVYPGLDLTREIRAVADQGLGDTVLIRVGAEIAGFGVCHHGPMSEAGSAQLLVKFGAVRPGPHAEREFAALLSAAESMGRARGAPKIVAGTNVGREGGYGVLLGRGYRTFMNGVAMIRPGGPGYNVPGAYVIDDWR